MKTLTVRLPDRLAADIEAEARKRGVTKSDIVREWLERSPTSSRGSTPLDAIADLIGSVDDDLPSDLSARKKHYRTMGYALGAEDDLASARNLTDY
jgi:hypothetical protein